MPSRNAGGRGPSRLQTHQRDGGLAIREDFVKGTQPAALQQALAGQHEHKVIPCEGVHWEHGSKFLLLANPQQLQGIMNISKCLLPR